jgi:hypothetical protein
MKKKEKSCVVIIIYGVRGKKHIRIDKTKMSIKRVEELEDVSEADTGPSMWEGLMRTSPPSISWWCLCLRKAFVVCENLLLFAKLLDGLGRSS